METDNGQDQDVRLQLRIMVNRLGPMDCERVAAFIHDLDISRAVKERSSEIGAINPSTERVAMAGMLAEKGTPSGAPEPVTLENVEACFTYQNADRAQLDQFTQVREAMIAAAKTVLRLVPACNDRENALACLRNARMWANSAISFRGRF